MFTLTSWMMVLFFLALTAVIAGLVPALIFFRTAADRRVLWIGAGGVVISYVLFLLGVPPLARVTVNWLEIYPVLAIVSAIPVGLVWRVLSTTVPVRTEEDRIAEIRERARAKARNAARGQSHSRR